MAIRIFRHYIRAPFFGLAVIEGILLFASVYAAVPLRFESFDVQATVADLDTAAPLWLRAAIFSIVMLLTTSSMGLYEAQRRDGMANILLRTVAGYALGALALTPLFYFIPQFYLGRGLFLLAVLISLVARIAMRLMFLRVVDHNALKRRVLVYGGGEKALLISDLRGKTQGFYVVGFVQAPEEEDRVPSHKLIRLNIPLVEFALEEEVSEIVVAVQDRRKSLPLDELLDCRLSGIPVFDPVSFLERETGKLNLAMLSPGSMIFSEGFGRGQMRRASQRLFDVAASAALLLVMLPVTVIAALCIRLESGKGQPILYRQTRVGQSGEVFEMLKFRSMRVGAEQPGEVKWAQEDDDRITRVGAVLRKYRVDEIPQVFNVLRGDMSLIGPRPERPEFVQSLSQSIPFYSERHRVKPGLTGWAQLRYPYGACEKDAYEKLQYDLYYVKNCSLFLDLMILLQTAEVVLWRRGAR